MQGIEQIMKIKDQNNQPDFSNTFFGDMDDEVSLSSDSESETEVGGTQPIQLINAEDSYDSDMDFQIGTPTSKVPPLLC